MLLCVGFAIWPLSSINYLAPQEQAVVNEWFAGEIRHV
jgi:hypothetical protein